MSNQNQWDFVLENKVNVRGPILEIGSKSYGGTSYHNFRADFPDLEYVGVDLEAGKGVDVICDMTQREDVWNLLKPGFRAIICLSVLEHCAQPFHMAENITSVLAPGGLLFVTVPFVWKMHGFPEDYWRFTPYAIRVLFPTLTVVDQASYCTSKKPGRRFPLKQCTIRPPKIEGMADSLYPALLHMVLVKLCPSS